MQQASSVVRKMDPSGRPVTASLSGIGEWPKLFANDAIDLVQIHPYTGSRKYHGQLDRQIIETVRTRLSRYGKPVFMGESGFDGGPPRNTLDVAERAETGLRHAFWASTVSGAMNGRMLWWADGYDQYQKPDPDLRTRYALLVKPAATFVRGIDYTGFKPIPSKSSPELYGAAIGHAKMVIAWFRDSQCIGPNWPTHRLDGERVTFLIPGKTEGWRLAVYDPVFPTSACPSPLPFGGMTLVSGTRIAPGEWYLVDDLVFAGRVEHYLARQIQPSSDFLLPSHRWLTSWHVETSALTGRMRMLRNSTGDLWFCSPIWPSLRFIPGRSIAFSG